MWSRTHAPVPLVDPEKLQFCITHGLNVLLQGRHGVGKTTAIRQAFGKAGLNLLIFSGSTMDPWVDFVGVPRPVLRPDGLTVLELIRRPELVDETVDAIFIDEFNRAPAKARNAAMELLQFKSVNGHRFSRLRSVWAAVNPANEDYDTEPLDPAQLDRFHVRIEIPFRPCPVFFTTEFGSAGRAALEWWDSQGEDVQLNISPRRLEYAVRVALIGGPVRDVLPPESNVRSLLQLIEEGPLFDQLKELLTKNDTDGARKIMEHPETGSRAIGHILGSKAAIVFFLPLLSPERLMGLMQNPKVLEMVVRYCATVPEFRNVINLVRNSTPGSPLAKKAEALIKTYRAQLRTDSHPILVSERELTAVQIEKLDPYGRIAE